MTQKGKAKVNHMPVLSLNNTILAVCMRANKSMDDAKISEVFGKGSELTPNQFEENLFCDQIVTQPWF